MLILGFPLTTWIIVPLIAIPIGVLLLYILRGSLIVRIWALTEAYFGVRLALEASAPEGRPDRVIAAMIIFSLYMLGVAVGLRMMRRKYPEITQ